MILVTLMAPALLFAAEPVHTPAPQSGPYSWTTGAYQYDASGNITAIGTWTFAYDPLSRLAASHVTTPPGAASDQTFTYDSFGNMVLQPASSTQTNHLDPIMATYDEAGEVTLYHPPGSGHAYGFTYDALGSTTAETMDGVPSSYFVYTPSNERLRIEGNGTTHWRVRDLGQRVLREFQLYDTTWSISRDYVYRGPLLAAITPTTLENFSLDHLNSPRLMTDVVGNEITRHTYLPFGQELGISADGEPMKFTGHERDDNPTDDAGTLDYMHARYYTFSVARFLSIDPAPASTLSPQSWNQYAYVHNSPVGLVDPTGTTEMEPLVIWDGSSLSDYNLDGITSHLLEDGGDSLGSGSEGGLGQLLGEASEAAATAAGSGLFGTPGQAAGWALSHVGDPNYEYMSPHPESRGRITEHLGGRKSYKCNAFVWDALNAGDVAPGRMPGGRIPSAGDWGSTTTTIPGYHVVPPGSPLKRGDIIGDGHHVGIYYPGLGQTPQTISAMPWNPVVHNDWGFRPGQKVTVHRCDCVGQ